MSNTNEPLAARMRPQNLSEFIGQGQIIGPGSFLRNAIERDSVPSLIFWGPPGTGKTTLAFIIAKETKSRFLELSAVNSGVKDLRAIIEEARVSQNLGEKTILFIDEIHRWNKAQQDGLLPHVERGVITLIGATTENPSFTVNSALISRSKVLVLQALTDEQVMTVIKNALAKLKKKIDKEVMAFIARMSDGDARFALNIIDDIVRNEEKATIDLVKKIIHKPNLSYDRDGENHYNIISALHKSMRGGDANASVYWLARMLEAGEDPLYVARRLVRFAAEDVGLGNNSALMLANQVFDACHKLGMPECNVHLAQLVIYMANSKKDITAYQAYTRAVAEIAESGNLPVPLHIRNAPTKLMKDLDYGKGYKYTPLEDSKDQEYLPEELKGKKFC